MGNLTFLLMGNSESGKTSYCNSLIRTNLGSVMGGLTGSGNSTQVPTNYILHLVDINTEEGLELFYDSKSPIELSTTVVKAISDYKGKDTSKRIDIANIKLIFNKKIVHESKEYIELKQIFGDITFKENTTTKEYFVDIMLIADEDKLRRASANVVVFRDSSATIDFVPVTYNSFSEFKSFLRRYPILVKEITIDIVADSSISLKDKDVTTITLLDTEGINDSSSRQKITTDVGEITFQNTIARIKTYVDMFGDKINGVIYCIPWGEAGSKTNIFDDINCCISHLIAKPIYLVVTKVDLELEELAKKFCNVDNFSEDVLKEDTDELLKVIDYLFDDRQMLFKERLSNKLTDSTNFEKELKEKISGLKHIYTQAVLTTSFKRIYRHISKEYANSKSFTVTLNTLIKGSNKTSLDILGQSQFVDMLNDYADFMTIKPLTDIKAEITAKVFNDYIYKLIEKIFEYADKGCTAIIDNQNLVFAELKPYNTKCDEAIDNDESIGDRVIEAIQRRLDNKMLGYKGTTCNLSFKKQLLEALPRALNTVEVPLELRPHINTLIKNINIFFDRIFVCSGCNQCVQGGKLHKRCLRDCKRTKLYKLSNINYDNIAKRVIRDINKQCTNCSYASSNYDMLNFGFCVSPTEYNCDGRSYCVWDILKTYDRTSFKDIFDLKNSYYADDIIQNLSDAFTGIIVKSL